MTPVADLDIVNRALHSLGCNPASSMNDTDKNQARAIADYYYARDEILRAVYWPACATRIAMKNVAEMATPWTVSTYYYAGDRVTNDSGKTYRCTTAGWSAAAGGPTGTGSAIEDGSAIWTYVEESTALNNWCHQTETAYVLDDLVAWDTNKVYKCTVAGTTGAASPPTGTDDAIEDGTVTWAYYGTIPHNRTVYAYQYLLPPDCLRIRKVPLIGAPAETTQGVQYVRESNWLYCDQDASHLLYTRRELYPERWDVLCQEVVSLKIASDIAFDVTGQKELAVLAFQKYQAAFALANPVAMGEAREAEPEVTRWEDVC